jgi:hypothetical protein
MLDQMKAHWNSVTMTAHLPKVVFPPPSGHPPVIKAAYKSNAEVVFSPDHFQLDGPSSLSRPPQKNRLAHSTAGGRELRLKGSPPCLF